MIRRSAWATVVCVGLIAACFDLLLSHQTVGGGRRGGPVVGTHVQAESLDTLTADDLLGALGTGILWSVVTAVVVLTLLCARKYILTGRIRETPSP